MIYEKSKQRQRLSNTGTFYKGCKILQHSVTLALLCVLPQNIQRDNSY